MVGFERSKVVALEMPRMVAQGSLGAEVCEIHARYLSRVCGSHTTLINIFFPLQERLTVEKACGIARGGQ